jgi:hypothetical protein
LGRAEGFEQELAHHHHVLTAACGSWWSGPHDHRGIPVAESRDGTPKGFHILSVDRNRYSTRLIPLGRPAKTQMRVLVDGPTLGGATDMSSRAPGTRCEISAATVAAGAARIIVDFFDGGPRSRVVYEIEGLLSPVAMDRYECATLLSSCSRNKASCKPLSRHSSHIWTAPLPASCHPARIAWSRALGASTDICTAPMPF